MARAATSPELALYRSPGKATKLRAAIFQPTTIYTARINQTFPSWDGVLEITYDAGSGTLANVLEDMTLLIGSTAGAWDVGIVRIRSVDSTKFYIGEASDVEFADNQYLTAVDDFGLWARHVLIDDGEPFMDGGIAYSDQHTNFDPVPILGGNRVLKLTGASVSTQFNAASSYVLDSTISAYAWSAPGSSSSSGMTTSTPTISWDSVGWKKVYLTLTAANGKTFVAVRYVYIWNDANPPPSVQIGDCRQDAEEGGWSFDITLMDECDVDTIRDHALVILFGEDYYGSTQSSIGPVTGCENIYAMVWIARETIDWNPEQGSVRFTAHAAHYWFSQIPSYPDGVELVSRPAAAWTEMRDLTVRKGLYHFLRWRTTATRIMDVFLPSDTKYTKEVSSLAQNLWEQLREMAFLQIFARAGVNAQGQLSIEIHPQLVPEASRTWTTVMTITKQDWVGQIDLERVTRNEVSQVNLSGVAVNESGKGTPYFSLSTGHTHSHYGKPEIQENLLVASQSDANQKAGLYYGWRNNPFPDVPIVFDAAIRLIDCFPRQQCNIVIDASDTPRGISYSGALIPKSIALIQDPETGYVHSEATFEAETFEAHAVNGDVPASGDVSIPPTPNLPPLPPIEILVPGTITPTEDGGPPKVLLYSTSYGIIYTENFHDDSPSWSLLNSGLGNVVLSTGEKQYNLIHRMFVCPNGAFYVGRFIRINGANWGNHVDYFFIARAPSIGGTFEVIHDRDEFEAIGAPGFFDDWGITTFGYNPLLPESVAFVMRLDQPSLVDKIYTGSAGTYAAGAAVNDIGAGGNPSVGLSYGLGNWLYTTYGKYQVIAGDGSSVLSGATVSNLTLLPFNPEQDAIVRASTTGRTYIPGDGGGSPSRNLLVGDNNLGTINWVSDPNITFVGFDCDPTGQYIMSRYGAGAKGKSTDFGSSWGLLPNLPPGVWHFAWAGTPERWIAAGGSAIRYTEDGGNTWLNKEGNILSVAPTGGINQVKVVGY